MKDSRRDKKQSIRLVFSHIWYILARSVAKYRTVKAILKRGGGDKKNSQHTNKQKDYSFKLVLENKQQKMGNRADNPPFQNSLSFINFKYLLEGDIWINMLKNVLVWVSKNHYQFLLQF